MPSLKAIRKRIVSVKNTKKITSAMKLVAGARLRRAQEAIWAARPYAARLGEMVSQVSARIDLRAVTDADLHKPLPPVEADAPFEELEKYRVLKAAKLIDAEGSRVAPRKIALVVLTSDRGLAGPFNSNVNRKTERFLIDNASSTDSIVLHIIGRKGKDYLKRKKATIKREWPAPTNSAQALLAAREVANNLTADFLAGEVDAVMLVYNEFKSAISQRVLVEPLLPVKPAAPDKNDKPDQNNQGTAPVDFDYEPSPEGVIAELVPLHVEFQIYRALLESIASEFGAKMSAMDSATRNASEMIAALTLQFNRARQAAITKELMEIIGGAEALKG